MPEVLLPAERGKTDAALPTLTTSADRAPEPPEVTESGLPGEEILSVPEARSEPGLTREFCVAVDAYEPPFADARVPFSSGFLAGSGGVSGVGLSMVAGLDSMGDWVVFEESVFGEGEASCDEDSRCGGWGVGPLEFCLKYQPAPAARASPAMRTKGSAIERERGTPAPGSGDGACMRSVAASGSRELPSSRSTPQRTMSFLSLPLPESRYRSRSVWGSGSRKLSMSCRFVRSQCGSSALRFSSLTASRRAWSSLGGISPRC